jgi:hypothetical protein
MNANLKREDTRPLHGNLLRIDEGREIAIYTRSGTAWVAEFHDGRGALFSVGAWFSTNHGGHVLRRMDLGRITPLPPDVAERIERLHQRMEKDNDLPVMSRAISVLLGGLCGKLARLVHLPFGPRSTHPLDPAT